MRVIFSFLSIWSLTLFCWGQDGIGVRLTLDTTFHSNGAIFEIRQMYSPDEFSFPMGSYVSYDSLGNLYREGAYMFYDGFPCVRCYEQVSDGTKFYWRPVMQTRGRGSLEIDEWKTYHSNGELAEVGRYMGAVTERFSAYCPKQKVRFDAPVLEPGPCAVGVSTEHLKEGEWLYFDELGVLIRREQYVDGLLVWGESYSDE